MISATSSRNNPLPSYRQHRQPAVQGHTGATIWSVSFSANAGKVNPGLAWGKTGGAQRRVVKYQLSHRGMQHNVPDENPAAM
jgi:hypothetical protein